MPAQSDESNLLRIADIFFKTSHPSALVNKSVSLDEFRANFGTIGSEFALVSEFGEDIDQ